MNSSGDPFHMVRVEVQNAVDGIEVGRGKPRDGSFVNGVREADFGCQARFAEWESRRRSAGPVDDLIGQIKDAIRTVEWDLSDLEETIKVVETNPARFQLASGEVSNRKRFVASTKARLEEIQVAISSKPELLSEEDMKRAVSRENERFVESESQMQQMIMNQQDEGLDQLASTVMRIGNMGRTMHDELEEQRVMLDELDDDMDSTHNRFGVLQEKLNRIIQETGRRQFCVIFGLLLAFIVLTMLVFAS